jgi:hypothetical protein
MSRGNEETHEALRIHGVPGDQVSPEHISEAFTAVLTCSLTDRFSFLFVGPVNILFIKEEK